MGTVNVEVLGAAHGAFAVTPSDTTEFDRPVHALWIGTEGNVAVEHADGTTATYTNVPVGWHPVKARKVLSTGTTAADIIAVYHE